MLIAGLLAVRKLLRLVRRKRQFLVFLGVAIAAAWLYVKFEIVRVDRDRLFAWAELTCAAAGDSFVGPHPPGTVPDTDMPMGGHGTVSRPRRGSRCQARIAGLAAYERHAAAESARILSQAQAAREDKTHRDVVMARGAAEAARTAATKMEKANAKVEADRAGADWFDALNDLAGLHAPGR